MKRGLFVLMVIWLAGAFGMSIYYDVQRKANCIEQEGFFKGWFWCKTDPVSMMELSGNKIELFIKGLGWPIRLFSPAPKESVGTSALYAGTRTATDSVGISNIQQIAAVATEDQFRSAICALEQMPTATRENLRKIARDYLRSRDQEVMTRAFEADEVPFHLTKCFKTAAASTMSVRTSESDLKHFYSQSERALVLVLMIDAISKTSDEQSFRKIGNAARIEVLKRNEQYYR